MSKSKLRISLLAIIAAAVAVGAALLLGSCTSPSPYYDSANPDQPAHHTPTGFRNNYTTLAPVSFWKWQWERWRDGLPKPPGAPTPVATPEVDFLHSNATEPTLTWIGHSTVLLQVGSYNIITDPQFSDRASPVGFAGPKRLSPPGLTCDQLPHIDMVTISHNHYDHLDLPSVKCIAAQSGSPALFVVPLGLESWFRSHGIGNVVELDWWDRLKIGSLEIFCVPAQHWSQRSLTDRDRTLWAGFYIRHHSLSFLFTGDTGYSRDSADIRARLGAPDVAAIPIGAYEPRWFMSQRHVDPDEAVRIYNDLGAKFALGIHWGTFQLTDESLDEPPRALAEARRKAGVPDDRFFVLKLGETRRLAPLLASNR